MNKTDYEMQEFFNLVKEMRQMQKKYFKFRDPFSLTEAKRLEKAVDTFIKDAEALPSASLFDGQQEESITNK